MSQHRACYLTHQYTNAQLRDILTNLTDDEACKKLGVSKAAIRYQRSRLGIPITIKRYWNDERVAEFIDFYLEHTWEEMALHYNTTVGYIKCLLTYFRRKGYNVPYLRR